MLEIAIMLEGQNGLNWPRWQRIAQTVEDLGYAGLFRSDHFTNSDPPEENALELWISLAWLASHTTRIIFGPLVTPMSFRHPVHTARMAAAVDDLSDGRLVLGLGAGWQAREHNVFGFDLLGKIPRFERFQEGLEVITRLLHCNEPASFEGKYYQLRGATLLPRPQRPGGPPVLIGGNGPKLTIPLAARYAREWNGVYLTPAKFTELNTLLDEALRQKGRQPGEVRRSLMLGFVYAEDRRVLEDKVRERTGGKYTVEELQARGVIAGNGQEIRAQLEVIESIGVQRVMLQWLELDNVAELGSLAQHLH